MVMTPSTMLELGTPLPDFRLPDTKGRLVSTADFKDAPALLVVFICNHCPFVRHILDRFVELAAQYQARSLAVLAVNPNDVDAFPEDSPQMMKALASEKVFTFPYLYDQTQQTAKAFHAACTPDFFLFDKNRRLVYRGQFDDSRPGNTIPVTGSDLRAALDSVLEGKPLPEKQKPSIGCNIKWKPSNAPDYAK